MVKIWWRYYDEACVDDKISHPLSSDVGGRGNLVIFYREARDFVLLLTRILTAWHTPSLEILSNQKIVIIRDQRFATSQYSPPAPLTKLLNQQYLDSETLFIFYLIEYECRNDKYY